MPKGKGTYGSQVGRHSKKKYYGGGSVDPFSTRNPEGVPAQQAAEAMEQQNMAKSIEGAIPLSNAMDRSQTMPDVEQYADGGAVKDTTKYIKKVDVLKHKTAGFDEAEKKRKAKEKAQKGMTPKQKIAAYKAKQAKADSTKGKSRLELMKERVKADKAKGKK